MSSVGTILLIAGGSLLLLALFLSTIIGYIIFKGVLDQKPYRKKSAKKEKEKTNNFENNEESAPKDDPKDPMYPTGSRLYMALTPLIAEMKQIPFEDLYITSFDGLKLHGSLLRGNPKEVVILVHGYRSCKENDFADKLPIYQKRGSTVLLLDDRAHGQSEGRYIGFSELDKYDVANWVDKINSLFDNPAIYLHGVSMGGATVIHTADMHLQNVKGIIDDCGFDSINHLTRALIGGMYHLPYFPIGHLACFFAKTIGHVDFKAADGLTCVAHTDIPIVFIHGTEDHFVPCYMSQQLYDACRSPKEILLIEEAGHAACHIIVPDEYASLVNKLLDGQITQP